MVENLDHAVWCRVSQLLNKVRLHILSSTAKTFCFLKSVHNCWAIPILPLYLHSMCGCLRFCLIVMTGHYQSPLAFWIHLLECATFATKRVIEQHIAETRDNKATISQPLVAETAEKENDSRATTTTVACRGIIKADCWELPENATKKPAG